MRPRSGLSTAWICPQAVDPLVDAIGMASRPPDKPVRAKKARASRSASARGLDLANDLRSLGGALAARAGDVVEQTLARAKQRGVGTASHVAIPGVNAGSAAQITEVSTGAIARWLEGDRPAVDSESAQQAWRFYGELAATREASLNDVIMHCLCWRDAVADVLQQSAMELRVSSEALSRALRILQLGTDYGFLRTAEAFDSERQRADEDVAFTSTHDQLTGLPNRTLILDRAERMLGRTRRDGTPVAALMIGLDNFKSVNETLSRSAGDELLRLVAQRLDAVVRDTDSLGRLGSDEFIVIAEDDALQGGLERAANRIQDALNEPFALSGAGTASLNVTASIGIAVAPRSRAEELLRDAEIAMTQAKWDGKGRSVVFQTEMREAAEARMELETDLRTALATDQFFLVYQPTFDLRDMRPTGVEALIRWRHPTRGVVAPSSFMPLLESTGMIIEVGRWVLREACLQGAKWRAAGHEVAVAVNVSARQLDGADFVCDVRNALAEGSLDARALTLEITETTIMRNVEEAGRRLALIKGLGVRVAIDDFGTGYSSMAQLQRLPVDTLKIDRSFISELTVSQESKSVVHALVQLGKALSIETLAEGIELPQELAFLQEARCDSGQGFLYARPLAVPAVEAFLRSWVVETEASRSARRHASVVP
jgi:diguanylate cyclase (GGDEF)-like protein